MTYEVPENPSSGVSGKLHAEAGMMWFYPENQGGYHTSTVETVQVENGRIVVGTLNSTYIYEAECEVDDFVWRNEMPFNRIQLPNYFNKEYE